MASRLSVPSFGKELHEVEGRQFVGHGQNAAPARSVRHTPTPRSYGVSAKDTLVGMVADSVRQMRESAVGLTSKEHDRLKQFSHGQYLSGVMAMVEIGQKCEELAPATAFAEALRGFQVQYHPAAKPNVLEAFRGESDANGDFDYAQIAYAADPTDANRLRAIEAGNRQLAETFRALNALHGAAGNPRMRR